MIDSSGSDCIFAIDFTSEGMTAAFVHSDGEEEGTAGFELVDFRAGEDQALDKLTALLAAKARMATVPIAAVAVSLACDLDRPRRRVLNFPEASWLNGQNLPDILGEALGVPVIMERRAVVSLAYDRVMLGLPETDLVVGCYVDTHYDTAIWHRGYPIVGKNGVAGNIAHMAIQDREDNCFCGKTGCVDLYGAGIRLRQIHTMIFPDTPRDELFLRHGDHPLLLDYLSMMAYPIAIEANVLDPDFLVLGGTIPLMDGFPRKVLEEAILRHTYCPEEGRETTFLYSVASTTPGVVCAAQYAHMKLGQQGG